MRFDASIALIAESYAADDIGQEVATRTTRTVYANEFAVGASEFYLAGANGMKADRVYQMRACDYADEKLMTVGGVEYSIIRTSRRGDWVTLTCERKVANR